MAGKILLKAEHIAKEYNETTLFAQQEKNIIKAVEDVNLTVYQGETLGVVGESGCGKSTLGKILLRLIEPSSGRVFFDGEDIIHKRAKDLKSIRKNMQIIFQDPYAALNPWMTAKELIAEPAQIHKVVAKQDMDGYVKGLMEKVGLSSDEWDRYPHQFSGGQRQRICIARALSVKPKFILCDEPVSALDVSIQSQIINLLLDVQAEFQLTYVFISHNFAVIRHIANRIAVMYQGNIVELAMADAFFDAPQHPYSQVLLNAVLIPDPSIKRPIQKLLADDVVQGTDVQGCLFYNRCVHRDERCRLAKPILQETAPNHWVACHRYQN